MNVFWRETPLTDPEQKLLNLCLDAHDRSVHRENISTVVLRNAGVGSLNYATAIAATLCSIGGIHAPLSQSFAFLSLDRNQIMQHIEMGGTVPGWGNSFEKDGIDPLWTEMAAHVAEHFPTMGQKIEEITLELHNHGKRIYPNPSTYTAAAAILLGIPHPISAWLFIHGRLIAWTKVYFSVYAGAFPQKGED